MKVYIIECCIYDNYDDEYEYDEYKYIDKVFASKDDAIDYIYGLYEAMPNIDLFDDIGVRYTKDDFNFYSIKDRHEIYRDDIVIYDGLSAVSRHSAFDISIIEKEVE